MRPSTAPWYLDFFGPDFWTLANHEYSDERTSTELAYLCGVLSGPSRLRQVIDLGCGLGRHAIGLARQGFDVVGLDVSGWALETAAQRAGRFKRVAWRRVDLLREAAWPIDEADAAVSVQSFGWGNDDEQLRFLQRVRQYLRPGGMLVLDFSNLVHILRNYVARSSMVIEDFTYTFERGFEPISSRSIGTVRVNTPTGDERVLHHDIRLYTPAEVVSLVRRAGFTVQRVDSDFVVDGPVKPDSRYVQVVATVPLAPRQMLLRSRTVASDTLDLRWSPDEGEWLDNSPAPSHGEGRGEGAEPYGVELNYAVDDPYGAERARDVLARVFHRDIPVSCISFAPGISALLAGLSELAAEGRVLTPAFAYPHLVAWASHRGADPVAMELGATAAEYVARIELDRPALVHLERPGLDGHTLSLEEVRAVVAGAADVGSVVLVDEANANYLGPAASCLPLALDTDNLAVLRGVSKGYVAGGLRVAFVISSQALTAVVRDSLYPLACSEAAYWRALKLVEAGDIFGTLRRRVREVKPEVLVCLREHGLRVIPGHPDLPWLLIRDDDGRWTDWFRDRRILVKRLVPAAGRLPAGYLLRLSVPLSAHRRSLFLNRMAR
jgi:histidinol-phosphate/aromatic aminotransferase/cobyric acid decarboxylase-like protein